MSRCENETSINFGYGESPGEDFILVYTTRRGVMANIEKRLGRSVFEVSGHGWSARLEPDDVRHAYQIVKVRSGGKPAARDDVDDFV